MSLIVLKKKSDRTPKKPESILKAALISSQRSFEIQEDCSLEKILGPLLQVSVGSGKRFISRLKIRPHPAGVRNVGPSPSPEVLDQSSTVEAGIQGLRKPEGEETQFFSMSRISGGCLQAPFHQKLEDTPSVESRRVVEDEVSLVRRILQKLDEQTRRFGPLFLQEGVVVPDDVPTLL